MCKYKRCPRNVRSFVTVYNVKFTRRNVRITEIFRISYFQKIMNYYRNEKDVLKITNNNILRPIRKRKPAETIQLLYGNKKNYCSCPRKTFRTLRTSGDSLNYYFHIITRFVSYYIRGQKDVSYTRARRISQY